MSRLDDIARQDVAQTVGQNGAGTEWPGYAGADLHDSQPSGSDTGWPGYAGTGRGDADPSEQDTGWPGYTGSRRINMVPSKSDAAWPGYTGTNRMDTGFSRPDDEWPGYTGNSPDVDWQQAETPTDGQAASGKQTRKIRKSKKAKAERNSNPKQKPEKVRRNGNATTENAAAGIGSRKGQVTGIEPGSAMEQDPLPKGRKPGHKWYRRIPGILTLTACIYVVFLIYGVMSTQYAYDSAGKVSPQVVSVEDIREKAKFDRVLAQYYALRNLYERILVLDERIAQGIEDRRVVAGEYALLLSNGESTGDAQDIRLRIESLGNDAALARYSQVIQQMGKWLDDNVRTYLQLVQVLYVDGNASVSDQVMQVRAVTYENFGTITGAMAAYAEAIPGVDARDIQEWSPEAYVAKAVYGDEAAQ